MDVAVNESLFQLDIDIIQLIGISGPRLLQKLGGKEDDPQWQNRQG